MKKQHCLNALKLACLCSVLVLFLLSSRNSLPGIPASPANNGHDGDDAGLTEDTTSAADSKSTTTRPAVEKRLVVASVAGDDASWIARRLPDWQALVYVADDPSANLTVPINKGHESMTYLTYIIDHYDGEGDDGLADVQVFIHSLQYQWHNDDANKDGATMISRLQLAHVRQQGYVNLRCTWTIGCPDEIRLDEEAAAAAGGEESAGGWAYFRPAFMELFPARAAADDVPSTVAVSCCAQFAVTAAKVRERPRSEYVRVRDWIVGTPLSDYESGRVMEYSWHMLCGRPAVHCPRAPACYCQVFGLCGLEHCSDGQCDGLYTLPAYTDQPADWKPLDVYDA